MLGKTELTTFTLGNTELRILWFRTWDCCLAYPYGNMPLFSSLCTTCELLDLCFSDVMLSRFDILCFQD